MSKKSKVSYIEEDWKSDIEEDYNIDNSINYDHDYYEEDDDKDYNQFDNRVPISLDDFLNPSIKKQNINIDNNYDEPPNYEIKLLKSFSKDNNNLDYTEDSNDINQLEVKELDIKSTEESKVVYKPYIPKSTVPLVNPLVNSCLQFEFTEYHELWFHLFTFLPIESRAKFMSVCRLWFHLLTYSSHSSISWRKLYMDKSKIGNEFATLYTHGREWCQAYGYIRHAEKIMLKYFQVVGKIDCY